MASLDIEKVKKSYIAGKTLNEIATDNGVTMYRVKKVLLSAGLDKNSVDKDAREKLKHDKLKDEYKHLSTSQIDEIRETYRSGHAIRFIAKKHNLKALIVTAIVGDIKRPKRSVKQKSS